MCPIPWPSPSSRRWNSPVKCAIKLKIKRALLNSVPLYRMDSIRARLAEAESLEQFSKHRLEALRQRFVRFTDDGISSEEGENGENFGVGTEIDELLKNYMDVSELELNFASCIVGPILRTNFDWNAGTKLHSDL